MGKSFSRNHDCNGHGVRNTQVADALATAMDSPQVIADKSESLEEVITDLFNGVERQYRLYGMNAELRMYQPRGKKRPYPMFFIQGFVRNHKIGEELGAVLRGQDFGVISLDDLRKHPTTVQWWAPTDPAYNAKVALAYFLHGQSEFISVARSWWEEWTRKENEKHERVQKEKSANKIETLRKEAVMHQLRTRFAPLTSENALLFVRYTPNMWIAIFDKSHALYVSTDVQKIYVEDVDPEHPLAGLKPVGLFINRAALRNKDEDPSHYDDLDDTSVAKKAYLVRKYLRTHPLLAEALKPRVEAVETEEGAQPSGVSLGNGVGTEESATS